MSVNLGDLTNKSMAEITSLVPGLPHVYDMVPMTVTDDKLTGL